MKRRILIGTLVGVTLLSLLTAFQRHEEAQNQRRVAEFWRLEAERHEAELAKLRQTAHMELIRSQQVARADEKKPFGGK